VVSNGYAYVADRSYSIGDFQIIDARVPDCSRIIGGLDLSGEGRGIDYARNHAFVTVAPLIWPKGELWAIDVVNPTDPLVVGKVETMGPPYDVVVRNSIAYVGERRAGLRVIDVSNPAKPRILGYAPGESMAVDVAGDLVYSVSTNGLSIMRRQCDLVAGTPGWHPGRWGASDSSATEGRHPEANGQNRGKKRGENGVGQADE
jgi:hypothetical protein